MTPTDDRTRRSVRWPTLGLGWALVASLLVPPGSEAADRKLAGRIVSVSGKVMIRQESGKKAVESRPAAPGKEIWEGDIVSTPSDGKIKLLLTDRSIMDIGPSSLFKLDQMKNQGGGRRTVDATMAYGSLRAGVTQKLEGRSHFKVRTASATMGVRGTEFVVKSEVTDLRSINQVLNAPPGEMPKMDMTPGAGKTEVTVLQGKVEVATPPPAVPPAALSGGGRVPAAAPPPTTLLPGMQMVAGPTAGSPDAGAGNSGGRTEVRQLDTQALTEVAASSRTADSTFDQAASIQGTTKEEEAQQKREEKREEARADRAVAASERAPEAGSDSGKESAPETVPETAPETVASTEGANEGASESSADRGKRNEERQEPPTTDSAVASNERKEAPAGNGERGPSGEEKRGEEKRGESRPVAAGNRTPAAVSTMGGDVSRMMAGAVSTNIQTASNVISTVQVVNQIQGAINTNTLVTPTSTARTQQMHSLMIRFRAPSP